MIKKCKKKSNKIKKAQNFFILSIDKYYSDIYLVNFYFYGFIVSTKSTKTRTTR